MKKKMLSALIWLFFIFLLLFPEAVQAGAKEGLYLWYSTIIPILFPFILISNLLVETDSIRYITCPFFAASKSFSFFYVSSFYVFIFGWFCGYPMGAKAVADLVRTGKLSPREGNFLLPAANQASPMFLMGYIGIHIFHQSCSFFHILFFVYFPVFLYYLCGILLRHFLSFRQISTQKTPWTQKKDSPSFSLEHTIFSSFQIIVQIGVYMMIFTIIMRLILLLLPRTPFLSVFLGFLEMSTGISWLNGLSEIPVVLRQCLILSAAAFGGLCTCAQTFSVISNLGLSRGEYILKKLLLSSATFFLSWFFL